MAPLCGCDLSLECVVCGCGSSLECSICGCGPLVECGVCGLSMESCVCGCGSLLESGVCGCGPSVKCSACGCGSPAVLCLWTEQAANWSAVATGPPHWAFSKCPPENECLNVHHDCDDSENCTDLEVGFHCVCKTGYVRDMM